MKKIFLAYAFLFSQSSFAMFCPNNFNQIDIGNTLEQVQQQCGKPDSQTTSKVKKEDDSGPQEWTYYVQTNPTADGSIKMVLAFADKKIVNLSVNGIGLASTALCGSSVAYEDTMDTVKAACGKPAYVYKQSGADSSQTIEVTELKYGGSTPATLVFENGKLTERK